MTFMKKKSIKIRVGIRKTEAAFISLSSITLEPLDRIILGRDASRRMPFWGTGALPRISDTICQVMRKLIYKEEIRSHIREVHDMTSRILQKAGAFGFNNDALKDLRVAIDEGIANAFIHGNATQPHKRIRVKCYLHSDKSLEIRIKDQGKGFDSSKLPDPTNSENLLKSHGRGIFLIRQYMDRVGFNKRGNEIRMWKRKP